MRGVSIFCSLVLPSALIQRTFEPARRWSLQRPIGINSGAERPDDRRKKLRVRRRAGIRVKDTGGSHRAGREELEIPCRQEEPTEEGEPAS